MEGKLKGWRSNRNVLKLMQCREVNSNAAKTLKQRSQFSDTFIKRLGLEAELEGHQGCVNCLEWSPDGLHLASGSDDTNVILWDPFRHKQIEVIPTPHIGNIFSVKVG
jgi:WD and tetratricopeptide repeat-containing protein 1